MHWPCAACALGFERGDGGGLGQAVERHVDERGEAAGCGGAGGGGEAFPLGAAGLVDVDVGVDEAGQEGVVAEVVAMASRRHLARVGRRRVSVSSSSSSAARLRALWCDDAFERKACAII